MAAPTPTITATPTGVTATATGPGWPLTRTDPGSGAQLEEAAAQLEASGGKPSVLIKGVVNAVPFQQRRQPGATTAEYSPNPSASDRLVQVTP